MPLTNFLFLVGHNLVASSHVFLKTDFYHLGTKNNLYKNCFRPAIARPHALASFVIMLPSHHLQPVAKQMCTDP
jgi:hypothetical protein